MNRRLVSIIRRVYCHLDKLDSVGNFSPQALKDTIEGRLNEINDNYQELLNIRNRTQRDRDAERVQIEHILGSVYGIWHDLTGLKNINETVYQDYVQKTDEYFSSLDIGLTSWLFNFRKH